jgi:ribosome-associated translation inhibitor RaiA
MKLVTTFRGLDQAETVRATRAIERHVGRIERLLDKPVSLKAVVEGDGNERRVWFSIMVDRNEFYAESRGHDLPVAVTTACERLRAQIIKQRRRKASVKLRAAV